MRYAFAHEEETKKETADFILNAPKLSMGDECARFETQFAKWQGRKYAVLFNSGSSANLALLQSMKNMQIIPEKAKVGFSALTFSTNVMPIIQMGFDAIPIDCTPETLNVMSYDLENFLESGGEIDVLFISNMLGFAGDLDKIREMCIDRKILLIEDNCEALGSVLRDGEMTGNYGHSSTFSFFVAHQMSTIEGGMVCTDDYVLAGMLKIVRANGWDRNLVPEMQQSIRDIYGVSEYEAQYTFYDLGYNLRPTEITGFIGCKQLTYLNEIVLKREQNMCMLEETVKGNPDLIPPSHEHMFKVSNYAFPVICKSPELRQKDLDRFKAAGIETRPIMGGNITKQPFFLKYTGGKVHYDVPGAEKIRKCAFFCGNFPEMTGSDIYQIQECLK